VLLVIIVGGWSGLVIYYLTGGSGSEQPLNLQSKGVIMIDN